MWSLPSSCPVALLWFVTENPLSCPSVVKASVLQNSPSLPWAQKSSWPSWLWFQGPQVHSLPWVRPWPPDELCLDHPDLTWSQVYEWPCASTHWVTFSQILDLCYPRVPSLPGSWDSLFFFNWYVTEQGLEWFSGVIFRSDFQEWFSWPVLWPQHGVTLQHVPDPPHWKHRAAPSLVPQSSHSPAEPNPALASPAWPIPDARAASRASPRLSAFWKCQLSGFPQGQEIKSASLSAKQPVRLPGCFFLLAFASVYDRLKSQGAEELQQIFTLLSVVVAPGRPTLKCEMCCAWILDTAPAPRALIPADKEVAERWIYLGQRQTLNKTLTSSLQLQPVVCAALAASSSDWDVFCRQRTSAITPPNRGKVGEGFCCFLIFFSHSIST